MLTSYDYSMAKIVDAAGIDVILVGDSAANVMAGYETTVPITLDMMIYHARSVVRAVEQALVVVDLPFRNLSGQLEGGPRLGRPHHEGDRGRRREDGGRRGDPRIGSAHSFGRHSHHGTPRPDAPVDPQVRDLRRPRQGGGRGRKTAARRAPAERCGVFRHRARKRFPRRWPRA